MYIRLYPVIVVVRFDISNKRLLYFFIIIVGIESNCVGQSAS